MTEWIWMHNEQTGGTARFNAETEKFWLARGWQRCEEPIEESPHLRDPAVKAAETNDVGATSVEDQGPRTRRAARRGGETQED